MKYSDDLKKAKSQYRIHKVFLARMKRVKPKELDSTFLQLHEHAFREIDCLECANCCKTTSPIFTQTDIERLSRFFKMKIPQFIGTYLKIDEEGDYILREAPCPFLGAQNKCMVYEARPRACRDYPHTNRKRMYQITSLTLQNTLICPAVSRIVSRLQQEPL